MGVWMMIGWLDGMVGRMVDGWLDGRMGWLIISGASGHLDDRMVGW